MTLRKRMTYAAAVSMAALLLSTPAFAETEETEAMEEDIVEENLEEEPLVRDEFQDVSPDYFAYGAIYYLFDLGIIKGKTGQTFEPNSKLTRAEAAHLISSTLGLKASSTYELKAKDVSKKSWAYDSLRAVEEQGLMIGNEGNIRPADSITRAEVSVLLHRAFSYAQPTRFYSFEDVKRSSWAYDSVNILAANGITTEAGGLFRPKALTTRGEFSLFLARSLSDEFK
ncbi:S-layer homology domain-containing protein [Halalkalibacter urbisdiaboli]|uniref:S-layer homology domain-containing protein n=1 Tax=Halalkalibacter urbisdiaboli TaxID=1960589 RepID=UPI000B434C46|nr:S-layer homology domain-containing protein [Halalkalibacter urbisdiaboli]